MYNFDDMYQYTAHWFLLFEGVIMQFSSAIVDFYFYLLCDGPVDMQIWVLLTRSQCSVSDTRVTVKAHGPFV